MKYFLFPARRFQEVHEKMTAENEATMEARYQDILTVLKGKMRDKTSAYETMSIALGATAEALCAEAGTFWYYDRFKRGYIIPRATCGGAMLDVDVLSLGEGVAGKVIEAVKPTVIPDCQQDPRWAGKVDARTGFVTKSMLCVPLTAKGAVYGCLQFINKQDDSAYNEADLELVTKLARDITKLFLDHGVLKEYMDKIAAGIRRPYVSEKKQAQLKKTGRLK